MTQSLKNTLHLAKLLVAPQLLIYPEIPSSLPISPALFFHPRTISYAKAEPRLLRRLQLALQLYLLSTLVSPRINVKTQRVILICSNYSLQCRKTLIERTVSWFLGNC